MHYSPRVVEVGSKRQRILLRIDKFVYDVLQDPVFRRELRYRPRAALGNRGFEISPVPSRLPIVLDEIGSIVNAGQIFGLSEGNVLPPPLELRLVAYGVKPAALVHGYEPDLVGLRDWAERRGLTAVLSPHEWEPVPDEGKGGFSNLTGPRRRAQAGSSACRSLVVAADEDQAILGWLSLLYGWDELLGRILGYPECCVQFFCRKWDDAEAEHQGDLAWQTLKASGAGPHDWRVNILARYFGYQVVQHFPCRLECTETARLAAAYADALACYEPAFLSLCRDCSMAPVLYTERDGVVALLGGRTHSNGSVRMVTYDPSECLATQTSGRLFGLVSDHSELSYAWGSETVFAGGHHVHAILTCFRTEAD